MKTSRHPAVTATAIVSLTLSLPASLRAGLLIYGTVTPTGGSFRYTASVENTDTEDYFLISLDDAPLGDPLIGLTLTTPAGFLGSYDGGLGLVDLLSDIESFAPGTTSGPFSFESLSGPDHAFGSIEGLFFNAATQDIETVQGDVRWTIIPEPGAAGTVLGLALLAGVTVLRRQRR